MRRGWYLIAACVLFLAVAAWAQDGNLLEQVQKRIAGVDARVEGLRQGVADLEANYAKEIDERDRLMLQRRFVEGREFYYMLHDYRGASEVFWPLVHHPMATKLPNYFDAVYYLAESLFHSRFYPEARQHYQILYQARHAEYFGISLMRLIETAVVLRNYDEADRLYAVMLAEFPEEEDGSLGRYIIGKSFYLRGEVAKAVEILDSIPETGNYYLTAQYFIAVLYVKQKNYQEAVNRLRRLRRVLDRDMVNEDKIYALAHLALGRIFYELNDFPQAMANYYTVSPDSPEYSRALYESMWVFITRNDFMIRALEDERTNFEDLYFDHTEFREGLPTEEEVPEAVDLTEAADQLEGELQEIQGLFGEIEENLVRLQEEALTSFNKMVHAAPNHALLPEAEILVGNIYTQVEEYEAAEEWYTRVRTKYENFYTTIRSRRPSLTAQDRLELLQTGTVAAENGEQLDEVETQGLPPEVVYWLAQETELKQLFAVYRAVLHERENLQQMQRMLAEIENLLGELESEAGGFPFLREAKRRSNAMKSEIGKLQVELAALRNDANKMADAGARSQIIARASSHEQTLHSLQGRLAALQGKIEQKKQERLAFFRQELSNLRQPVMSFAGSVESLYARTSNATAQLAAQELEGIENRVRSYVDQADLGIIDTAWRASRGSTREIREIQRELQRELNEFERLQRQQSEEEGQPEATAPAEESGEVTEPAADEANDELAPADEAPAEEPDTEAAEPTVDEPADSGEEQPTPPAGGES